MSATFRVKLAFLNEHSFGAKSIVTYVTLLGLNWKTYLLLLLACMKEEDDACHPRGPPNFITFFVGKMNLMRPRQPLPLHGLYAHSVYLTVHVAASQDLNNPPSLINVPGWGGNPNVQ